MSEIYLSVIVGVLGVICSGLVALYYKRKLKQYRSTFNLTDIGILKMCKSNIDYLLNKHRPDRNVINIHEWKEKFKQHSKM